tara:strand:+ start:552 stop:1031 length:480 start_codon:yes stop_codon:yes gene_type:complete
MYQRWRNGWWPVASKFSGIDDMTISKAEKSETRDATGRFVPGHSIGRPKGSKSAFNKQVLAALGDLTSQAMAVLKERLNQNDLKAATFVLARFLPEHRLTDVGSVDPTAWADAMATGEITVSEAGKAAQALKTISDAGEVKELRARLDEIETLITAAKK